MADFKLSSLSIQNDMKAALKAQDKLKLSTIRMLLSEIKKREIDKRAALEEAEIQQAVLSLVKQRRDAIEAFEKGNRSDLAEKEKAEIVFLQAYLPTALETAEIETLVRNAILESKASGPGDIGKIMKQVLAQVAGRADGKTVHEVATRLLAG